ncbi:hypothetical protein PTW37_14475 [Arthrobacter agilis]|nr:hypothetical protein [Arthrobacter agilis]WDF33038.1 hypothetical protein PTW37_14475 [Arthrobacter agilis]
MTLLERPRPSPAIRATGRTGTLDQDPASFRYVATASSGGAA